MVSQCKTHDQYAHFQGALAHSYVNRLFNRYKIFAYSDNIETQLDHFMHPSQGLNKIAWACIGYWNMTGATYHKVYNIIVIFHAIYEKER